MSVTVAAVAVCAMGIVVAPAGVRAGPGGVDASAPFDKATLAAQGGRSVDAAEVDPVASVGPLRPLGTELEQAIGDAAGDVGDARGDIIGSYVGLFAEGTTDLEIRVSRYDDLFGQNWRDGDTYVLWTLKTPGTAPITFYAQMFNFNGQLYGVVLDSDRHVLCGATGLIGDRTARVYGLTFDTGCLPNPSSITWTASFHYEIVGTGTTVDNAPDAGDGPSVPNSARKFPGECTPHSWDFLYPPLPPEFVPLQPRRILDTRFDANTADCLFGRGGLRADDTTLELQVAGRLNVPADAIAVALNVTVTGGDAAGFVTAFPCGSTRPTASNLNYTRRQTAATAVVAGLGVGGKVCLYVYGATHLIADIGGFFPSTGHYATGVPARLLDTREVGAPSQAGQVTELQVAGRGGVPIDATTAVLSVTAVDARQPGFVTAYPCGSTPPTASTVNYRVGEIVANLAVVKIGAGGKVCVFTYGTTDLLADVNGWFTAGSTFASVVPTRVLDTRTQGGGGLRAPGQQTVVQITGVARLPPGPLRAVSLNVTADGPTDPGFVAVYPCNLPRPIVSNLNYEPGDTRANAVIVGSSGSVCVFTYQPTHLIIDVTGYWLY